jgi:hypothetical protein
LEIEKDKGKGEEGTELIETYFWLVLCFTKEMYNKQLSCECALLGSEHDFLYNYLSSDVKIQIEKTKARPRIHPERIAKAITTPIDRYV